MCQHRCASVNRNKAFICKTLARYTTRASSSPRWFLHPARALLPRPRLVELQPALEDRDAVRNVGRRLRRPVGIEHHARAGVRHRPHRDVVVAVLAQQGAVVQRRDVGHNVRPAPLQAQVDVGLLEFRLDVRVHTVCGLTAGRLPAATFFYGRLATKIDF